MYSATTGNGRDYRYILVILTAHYINAAVFCIYLEYSIYRAHACGRGRAAAVPSTKGTANAMAALAAAPRSSRAAARSHLQRPFEHRDHLHNPSYCLSAILLGAGVATTAAAAAAAGPSCPPGLVGPPACARLDLGPVLPCGAGGLCIRRRNDWGGNASTWTGAVLHGDDGRFHMFGGLMANGCPLMGLRPGISPYWLTNAVIVYATSSSPAGPYAPQSIALPARERHFWDGLSAQSPAIARAPDGTWLLFYIGTTRDEDAAVCNGTGGWSNTTGGGSNPAGGMAPEARTQRIGLATSKSPEGPWERRDAPILGPGEAGKWDDLFTADMAPWVFANGSVLLVYKARSREGSAGMAHGLAFAGEKTRSFVSQVATCVICQDKLGTSLMKTKRTVSCTQITTQGRIAG